MTLACIGSDGAGLRAGEAPPPRERGRYSPSFSASNVRPFDKVCVCARRRAHFCACVNSVGAWTSSWDRVLIRLAAVTAVAGQGSQDGCGGGASARAAGRRGQLLWDHGGLLAARQCFQRPQRARPRGAGQGRRRASSSPARPSQSCARCWGWRRPGGEGEKGRGRAMVLLEGLDGCVMCCFEIPCEALAFLRYVSRLCERKKL